MNRILIMVFIVPSIRSIIVKDPPPNGFEYSYNIDDPTTGDRKSQHEVWSGDTVTGSYSVLDPDGTKRTVEYTADPTHGFKAVVHTVPAALETPRQNYEVLPALTISANYLGEVQHNPIPFYPKQNLEERYQNVYFSSSPYKKTILRDSLGPGQYFMPSAAGYYHR